MKKRVSGFLLAAVLVAVMIMTSMPMGIKAAEGSGNNQLNVIQDSEVNLALKKGDTYKVQFSIADSCMDNVTSAEVYESYRSFDGHNDDIVPFEAVVSHDESSNSYMITLEGTIADEANGIWCMLGVKLNSDSDQNKEFDLGINEMEQYRHYVIDDTVNDQLVLECQQQNLTVGDQFQLKAVVIPSFTQADVEWKSYDESIATVDDNGLVTVKAAGAAYIYAEYKGNEYMFHGIVKNTDGTSGENKNKQLSNEIKVVSNATDGKALQTGDDYEVVMSVADDGIENPNYAELSMVYAPFTDEDNQLYKSEATFSYDAENHCYLVTFAGTVTDDIELGTYKIQGVTFGNKDNGNTYYIEIFDNNTYEATKCVVGSASAADANEAGQTQSTDTAADESQNATISVTSDMTAVNETASTEQAAAVAGSKNPKTGDHFPVIYVGIAGISFCVIAAVAVMEIRKRKINE